MNKLAWSWLAWSMVPDFHATLICVSTQCHSTANSRLRTSVELHEELEELDKKAGFLVKYETRRAGSYQLQLVSSAGTPVSRLTNITVLPEQCDLTTKLPTIAVECPCAHGRPVRFRVTTYDKYKNPTSSGKDCQLQKDRVSAVRSKGTASTKLADSLVYNFTSLQFEGKFTGLEPGEYVLRLEVLSEAELYVEKSFRVSRSTSP